MASKIKLGLWIIGLIVLAAFVAYHFLRDEKPAYEYITAERRALVQEVSVTGRVKPADRIDLAFEKGGKVSRVFAGVGDRIGAGSTLVVLDNATLLAELAEAEADVKVQQAKLDELRRGTRDEEIRVQEVKVANSRVAFEDARKDLVDKINDAYTKSDDAVRNKVDQFFISPRSADPKLDFSVSDSSLKRSLEGGRLAMESMLISWSVSLVTLNTADDLAAFTKQAEKNLTAARTFLNDASLVLSTIVAGINLSQTTINGYRSDISAARTNVNTATVNLSAADEGVRIAQSAVALAEEELLLKRAGTLEEQIAAQEAKVEQSEAAVFTKRTALSKTDLVSPLGGIVTRQDAKIGEIVAANSVIASIISESQFEIEVNVPEVDVAKLSIGDRASVTLDAYRNDIIFEAFIAEIDPAETIVEGVATYKTTLQFSEPDIRIKSGMTANIDIRSDERADVIAIPQRAIITRDGKKIVRILDGEGIKEVAVITGLRGSDGSVEIIEGIRAGDKVIVFYEILLENDSLEVPFHS